MSAQITLDWKKDSTFETQMDGHTVTIDTSKEDGGTGSGVRPKALMLVGRLQRCRRDLSFQENESSLRQTVDRCQSRDIRYDPGALYCFRCYLPCYRKHRRQCPDRKSDPSLTGKVLWCSAYDEKDRPHHLPDTT